MFIDAFEDPLDAFLALRAEVRRTAPPGFDPDTVTLATADAAGQPSARVVLLRHVGPDGLRFFTNYGSRKGLELERNPRAALCAHWYWLRQQVRVEGPVRRAADVESDAYFAERPRGSQLGAWASNQSAPIASRGDLEDALGRVASRFEGRSVSRPEFWGGFELVPERVEFWEECGSRLHDRVLFVWGSEGWTRTRLAP